MADYMVSICCITFNHEKFIRQCIDGFIMQQTSFEYEILIHDDASTDNTVGIIKEYETKYPNLIKPIYQIENQYSQGANPTIDFNLPRAKGKYIALCEGDDYWTDPFKLQKQVEILETKKGLVACFTNAKKINEVTQQTLRFVKDLNEGEVSIKSIYLTGGGIYPTTSLIFKNRLLKFNFFKCIPELNGDDLLIYLLAAKGNIYFLDEITCVYRRWEGGVYSSITNNTNKLVQDKKRKIIGLDKYNKLTNYKFNEHIRRRISLYSYYIMKNSKGFDRLKYIFKLSYIEFFKLVLVRKLIK